jgi:hypothetical protein
MRARTGNRAGVRRVLLLAVVAIAVAAPAHAAGPSTVTVRGDATHDNRVTGAPEQASVRLRRVRRGVYRAAATLRALRRGRTTVLACYRERTPDPWGRAGTLDARCGARRVDLPAPAPARATASIAAALGFPRLVTERFTAAPEG